MLVKRHAAQALSLAAALFCGVAVLAAPAHGAQSASSAAAPAAQPSTPPAAPAPASGAVDMAKAKQTFETTCSGCHDPGLATTQRLSRQGWQQLVDRMVGLGLSASDAQLKEIVDYLSATYPAQ